MIYLDYSATTPVRKEVLDSYNKVTTDYIGNPNSLHSLGLASHDLLVSATDQIANIFNIKSNEIIMTSGATESNNLALVGYALKNKNKGNKIVVSKLEHPSIYGICDYLKTLGFEIDYVDNNEEGLIDFNDLQKKVTSDTILVSIVYVNSEMGIREPLKTIRQTIKKANPNAVFHSDMTQAVGKVHVNMHDVDMASISSHKIYGPKGIGMLYKNEKINIEPIIHGADNTLRGGTPSLPLIVAFSKAIRLASENVDNQASVVKMLNDKIIEAFKRYKDIKINQTSYTIPHILNISLMNIKPEVFIHALEKRDIYIGSNTACSSAKLSKTVMEVYHDETRASTTLRICLSYMTSFDDISKFLYSFDIVYNKLNSLGEKDEKTNNN